MKNKIINVAIIEDHSDFREGLAHLLNSTEGFNCIAKYHSVEHALESFIEPDVLLLDIHLPGQSGIEAISYFKEKFPQMQIIMLTVFDDDGNIFNAILAGADGYLLKRTSPVKILASLEDVLESGMPMSPYVAKKVVDYFRDNKLIKNDYQLSQREKEVLTELVNGSDSKQIAEKLFISYETVRNHLKNIYQKLHVNSRTQAVSKALKDGIIK